MFNYEALQPKPTKILVIAMRYLGDVLLVTPLLRSLRKAYPAAQLDVLIYHNTASVLEGNNDVNNIITTPLRSGYREYITLIRRIFRCYELALIIQTGDRPFLYGLLAASMRVSVVPAKRETGWWKRFFVQRWTEFDNKHTHTVIQNLKLADLLAIPRESTVVPPQTDDIAWRANYTFLTEVYVVLHPCPQWHYKRWTVENWIAIGRYLNGLGFKVVISAGPLPDELEYIATIMQQLPDETINLAGQLSLAQLRYVIEQAKLYIGPDTGITHLAAAIGVPVIALYGPTNPIKWAPWPSQFAKTTNPFERVGNQRINNVNLIQGLADCVPCYQEGCLRHRQSHSQCLDVLSVEQVKYVINQILVV